MSFLLRQRKIQNIVSSVPKIMIMEMLYFSRQELRRVIRKTVSLVSTNRRIQNIV